MSDELTRFQAALAERHPQERGLSSPQWVSLVLHAARQEPDRHWAGPIFKEAVRDQHAA